MSCDMPRETIDALVDGQLSADEATAVRAHLTGCSECSARMDNRLALRDAMRGLPPHRAPDVLRARIRSALSSTSTLAPRTEPVATSHWPRFVAAAVFILAAGGLGWFIHSRSTPVADQVLASHLRSLMPGHLTDVQSTNQHNVKPWFNGRVNLAPSVPNLDSAGFALLGGRVDYVDGHPAAVIVYGRRLHVINVFNWVGSGDDLAPVDQTKNGFHLIHARSGGIEEWMVSDLNATELDDFARRYLSGR